MTADEFAVDGRVLLVGVHQSVERHLQVLVVYCQPALITLGRIAAVQRQVVVGIAVVGQLSHAALYGALQSFALRRQVHRHGSQLRHVQHLTNAEAAGHYACVIMHVLVERVAVVASVGGDGTQRRAERSVQRQVVQPPFYRTAVVHVAQAVDRVG